MALPISAAIPAAPRKTLQQWIEHDDGDTPSFTPPACSRQAQTLHSRIINDPNDGKGDALDRITAPSGLKLPPLG